MEVYLAGTKQAVDTGDTYFNELSNLDRSGSIIAKQKVNRERLKSLEIKGNIKARIEHGRWIVDCPNCNSAEFLFEDNLFFCSTCNSSDIQGSVRSIIMPAQRVAIENALSKRAIINRHWYPNETVADLIKENLKMGVI